MKHFINLKDIPAKDLRKIIIDAKKRKNLRKNLSTLESLGVKDRQSKKTIKKATERIKRGYSFFY